MKKTLPILICIILLIAIDVKIMLSLNNMSVQCNKELDLLQSQIDDLKTSKTVNTEAGLTEEKEAVEKAIIKEIPYGEVSKDKFKVASDSKNIEYSKDDEIEVDSKVIGVDIKIADEKAYITIDSKNDVVESILKDQKIDNFEEVENKEIIGFSSAPVEVFFGGHGQDVVATQLYFLMEDGTVEYINYEEMIKTQNYESAGKINGLSDIIGFDILTVTDIEGGGYITTIAIDKDGYYYDINELL